MPPLPPLCHPPLGGPKAQWREAQRLRLAGACLYASAVLVVSCGAFSFLIAAVSAAATSPTSKFSLSAVLWSSLLSPRVALAALLMSAAQGLAVVATGNAARACPPSGPKALAFVSGGGGGAGGRRRQRRRQWQWLAAASTSVLSAADSALTRLLLDGAASTRAGLTLLAGCAVSGWAIVPLFSWMAQGSAAGVGGSPPSPSPPQLLLSTPPWAPTLGLLVGAAHALLSLALGDDVVLVPALRRARAFVVKRAAAESAQRAAATAAAAAALAAATGVLRVGEEGGGATPLASALVALLGAALAAHALLVAGASVRAAFGERTQFVDSGLAAASTTTTMASASFSSSSAAARALASANDGLVAAVVEARTSPSSPNSLEASLFDLAVRADAAALAEASAGSSGAWRRAALFADGVAESDSSAGRSGGGVVIGGGRVNGGGPPRFPGAFPGRAWSAVVGGLCLAELAPALAAVGAALGGGGAAAASAGAPSTSGRAAAAASSTAPHPRWNERSSAATEGAGGAMSSVFFAAAKRLASAATSLLSSSSSKPLPPFPSTKGLPPPLPPAVLKAMAASLLRQRWQHLTLALRTLGALAAAAAEEDAAGVAQLAGGGGGDEGDDLNSPSSQFLFSHPGTDLGSVLSVLLAAAVAFGAAAEPGALPPKGAGGGGGMAAAALAPPGLGKLAAALAEEEAQGASFHSSYSPRPHRDPAASALADAALAAAHRAVAAYGKDARRALLSARVKAAPSVLGSGVSEAAVAALAEAVLAGRD